MNKMTIETKKLIQNLLDIVFERNINQALKANVDKISKYFIAHEYELNLYDKQIINSCMTYIAHIKQKYSSNNLA